jgi:DNA-binding protein H-NS
MAKSLQQIEAQIARLQAQAEAVRQREAAGVIARIKDAIAHYGLTAEDLGFGSNRKTTQHRAVAKKNAKPQAKRAKTAKPRKVRPSYSDGVNTWSGMGPKPKWFKEALAAGKSLEDLTVQAR